MFTAKNSDREYLVQEVMLSLQKFPVLNESQILKEALEEMNIKKLGIACIVDQEQHLLGVLTDGDIRRKLLSVQRPFSSFFVDDALDHAVKQPIVATSEMTLRKAISVMEEKGVWDLPVTNRANILVGLLHLHPAVKALLT